MKKTIFILFLFFASIITAQNATIKGTVKNKSNEPIEGVAVTSSGKGTVTNKKGEYSLKVDSMTEITVIFSHISYQTFEKKITIPKNRTLRFSPKLEASIENIKEVIVKDNKKEAQGIISVDPIKATTIPGAKSGIENVLLTMGGVSNNNELTTQYNVRGGNYDENLVYVNGIEVYRPFLVRSGQQEGLSFVNENLVENVKFSAGGFQAKYGDKLSSVLDITYRTPTKFAGGATMSFLGGSVNVEGSMFKDKLRALLGIRYHNNSLFINSKDTETNSNPNFSDAQLFLTYFFNKKFKLDLLGVYSLNNYNFIPKTRRTKFGTFGNEQELTVFYDGQEKDAFKTVFGALKGTYIVNENLNFSLTTSLYHTVEEEYYDIFAAYFIGDVNSDFGSDGFGEVEYSEGIGSQLNHARNDLDALIGSLDLKGTFKKDKHQVEVGVKYKIEDIRDRIKEWEMIDNLGFSIRPDDIFSNDEPYEPYDEDITLYKNIKAKNNAQITRLETFAQYSKNSFINDHKIWYNLGIRFHKWNIDGDGFDNISQNVFSLRGQFAIKPDWDKDMLFRISGGMYNQPPFYKELRDFDGNIVPNVDAQKSLQLVIGNEYSFEMWKRPFKLVSEAYYKNLSDVNVYSIDNVKIRYMADNNAKAYATGFDLRLNGEFVPGTESWVSLGFLKTEDNYNDRGYISRPTDQRFKFAILFQDYVPNIPKIRMYLNLVYNTGLPGGAPSYQDRYEYQSRLNDYKRADIGVFYVFTDEKNKQTTGMFKSFKDFSLGVEVFNFFDVKNAITNTWVRDVKSKDFSKIPNYMTSRVFNIKMKMRF